MISIPVMRRDHYDADNDGVVDESGASPLSDDNPQALGTANAGTGSSAARADHVHSMPNRARGAYDAIVYIQDDDVIAEDATGAEIDSGDAGTDDSAVLAAALSLGNKIYIAPGTYYDIQCALDGHSLDGLQIIGQRGTVLKRPVIDLRVAGVASDSHVLKLTNIDNILIQNLVIDCNQANTTNSDPSTPEHPLGDDWGGLQIGTHGETDGCDYATLQNIRVINGAGRGFLLDGASNGMMAFGLYAEARMHPFGIYVYNSSFDGLHAVSTTPIDEGYGIVAVAHRSNMSNIVCEGPNFGLEIPYGVQYLDVKNYVSYLNTRGLVVKHRYTGHVSIDGITIIGDSTGYTEANPWIGIYDEGDPTHGSCENQDITIKNFRITDLCTINNPSDTAHSRGIQWQGDDDYNINFLDGTIQNVGNSDAGYTGDGISIASSTHTGKNINIRNVRLINCNPNAVATRYGIWGNQPDMTVSECFFDGGTYYCAIRTSSAAANNQIYKNNIRLATCTASIKILADHTSSRVYDNIGFISRGEQRTYGGSISTLTENAYNSVDNPFGQAVALTALDIRVSTKATSAEPNIDCGIGVSATADYTTLFDDLPGESVGFYRSTVAPIGTQGVPQLWASGTGNRYLNMSIKGAAATGMVATYMATVMGL